MFSSLSNLPKKIVGSFVLGLAYGYFFKVDFKVAACAFAVYSVAETILFSAINPFFGGDLDIQSVKVSIMTNTMTSVIAIVAFRKLQLVARTGTFVMIGLGFLSLSRRISIISKLKEIQEVK